MTNRRATAPTFAVCSEFFYCSQAALTRLSKFLDLVGQNRRGRVRGGHAAPPQWQAAGRKQRRRNTVTQPHSAMARKWAQRKRNNTHDKPWTRIGLHGFAKTNNRQPL